MPNRIGNYRLGRTLGIGSFSKVKVGIHEPTRKRVAIKILNKKKLRLMEMESKVESEIAILSALTHPHIIRLYEVIRTQSDIFVVMEYVARGELFDYIVTNGRLSECEARKFFQQIVCGLEYCHYRGIVHRDLKPENLLLDDDGNLRIADFGLSNKMKDGFFLRTSCGSPNYAAPEVICDELYGGPEVDVWSCGVILYALLCGSLPFDDENIPNLFRKIKSGTFKIPTYLPEGPTNLIQRMLTVNPMKRIRIDEIKKHWWFNKKLPNYLRRKIFTNKINTNVIHQISSKMNIPTDDIYSALKFGSKLLIQRGCDKYKNAKLHKLRYAAVCYHLYADQLNRVNVLKDSKSSSPSTSTKTVVNTTPSQQKELHKRHLNDDMESFDNYYNMNNNMQWLIGLQTSSHPGPAKMMQHVLESLKLIKMEWFFNSAYCIVARYHHRRHHHHHHHSHHHHTKNKNKNENELKIQIQLYSSSASYNSSNFILDIQRISGQSFPFLDLCAKLMGAIKYLPQKLN